MTRDSQAAAGERPVPSGTDREPLLTPEFMARLGRLSLVARKVLSGRLRGERRSKKRGQSLEFADRRPYSQGDDFRRMDWMIYARLEKLFLKLFMDEEDLSVYILLDRSKSMDFGAVSKFDYARRVAAAIGCIALAEMDRVIVRAFSDGLQEGLEPLRGRRIYRLLRFLERLEPSGETSLARTARYFLAENPRPGICVAISDMLDPEGFEAPLKALAARQMDTFVIHVMAAEEVDPVLPGDVRLVDSETGESVEISAGGRALESYRKAVLGFRASLRDFCSSRGISYVPAVTTTPFERLVIEYLRSAGLVR
ncbi:MAG: DUF58 domain-containing protein [Planctomycetota bacterium]|nr:DUF58 domain-containing protein [Planctomycetota bacterium]